MNNHQAKRLAAQYGFDLTFDWTWRLWVLRPKHEPGRSVHDCYNFGEGGFGGLSPEAFIKYQLEPASKGIPQE
jgi:hypothetical protein